MEPFLQCQFIFLEISSLYPRRKTPVLDTYYRSGRRSCDFSLMRKATLYLHLRWLKGLSTWCSVYCSVGRSRRRRNRSGLISNKTAKKNNWWMQKQFQILSFQDGVKCTEVNFFLMTKFEDVWKFIFLCRLFYSSSFGASFPVSTKEFLWDLSFNAKL